MRELDDYLNRVKALPPAPTVLPELLALLHEEDVDNSRIVALIGYDPGLTANVLQLCNSVCFASSTPVDDMNEAVTRLGFNQVFRLVAAIIGARTMGPAQKGYGINKGELWKHSVTSAVAAQLMARRLGDPESMVYTATLLHDIGKIILSEALEFVYARLMEDTERNQQPLLETERQLLGVQHAEIGGRLLFRWRFPQNLVDAVTWHHAPGEAGDHARLASYVYLGNMVAHFMGLGYGHHAFALRGRAEALEHLNLSPDELPKFMIQTYEQLSEIEALFHLTG
jgi:putative nucleotidyltransferase with HDIG domain